MRSVISTTLAAVIMGLLGCVSVASACVRSAGYQQPSNFELVKMSGAIVRAVAVDTTVAITGYELEFETTRRIVRYSPAVRFRIVEILKGPDRIDSLLAFGVARIPENDEPSRSDFRYWRQPLNCSCCAADWYTLGTEYLLFLDSSRTGEWRVFEAAYARVAESIAGSNDPWYRTVRHYVAVDAIADYELAKQRLQSLLESARRGIDPVDFPLAMAADIEDHFSRPYRLKSYDDLVALLRVARDAEDTMEVLWSLANGKHPEGIELVRQLVDSGVWLKFHEPIVTWLVGHRDTSMIGTMIAEYDRLGGDREKTGPIFAYLVGVAGEKQKPVMLALLERGDDATTYTLARWFMSHPDPRATRRLKQYPLGRFETDRVREALAELGDEGVIREAFLHQNDRDEYGLGPWGSYYIIARSSHRLADSAFAAILKLRQDTLLRYIVQGLDRTEGKHRWARLRALASVPDLSPEVTYWLIRTLEKSAWKGEAEATELLAIIESRR